MPFFWRTLLSQMREFDDLTMRDGVSTTAFSNDGSEDGADALTMVADWHCTPEPPLPWRASL
jgi:hypothetical protein